MDAREQKLMGAMQTAANLAVEKAAKVYGKAVYYVNIDEIRSSSSESASEHIYNRLVHPDNNTINKLLDSIEREVLDALRQRGFEEEEFIRRIFAMAYFLRGGRQGPPPMPAAQVDIEAEVLKHDKGATKELWTAVLEGKPHAAEELIKKGADPNAKDKQGRSLLYHAAAGAGDSYKNYPSSRSRW